MSFPEKKLGMITIPKDLLKLFEDEPRFYYPPQYPAPGLLMLDRAMLKALAEKPELYRNFEVVLMPKTT